MELTLVDHKGKIFFQEDYDHYDMNQYHRIAYAVGDYLGALSDENVLKLYDIDRQKVFKEKRVETLICESVSPEDIDDRMLQKVDDGDFAPDTYSDLVHDWFFEIKDKFIPQEIVKTDGVTSFDGG